MSLENTTRRSFLKKTTVLTVGLTASGFFTGLVNATEVKQYGGYTGGCSNPPAVSTKKTFTYNPHTNGLNTPYCYEELECAQSDGSKKYCQIVQPSGVAEPKVAGDWKWPCDTGTGGTSNKCKKVVPFKTPGDAWP